VLGICNGFQIACEAGLLPGALLRNDTLRFVSASVHLRIENDRSMFTSAYASGQRIRLPVAHGDGRFTAEEKTLADMESSGQVLFRYVDEFGEQTAASNPNGSANDIAGIVSSAGNVLGMMPHPERALDCLLGSDDGLPLFESILATVAA